MPDQLFHPPPTVPKVQLPREPANSALSQLADFLTSATGIYDPITNAGPVTPGAALGAILGAVGSVPLRSAKGVTRLAKSLVAPSRVPVTRIIDAGLPLHSDKAATWFHVGDLSDEQLAVLRNMYKGAPDSGVVMRGTMPESSLSLPLNQSDEFGNRIASAPSEAVKQYFESSKRK